MTATSWPPPGALPFTCPVCGRELAARKSWAMESGHNSGHATCTSCKTFLHLMVDHPVDGPEVMVAQTWIEYRRQETQGLPWNNHSRLMYRSDLLSDRIWRNGWTLVQAVRYALKQGRFQTLFLSGLTFHSGAGVAMREVAANECQKAERTHDPKAVHFINLRVALLEGYVDRCAPAQPDQVAP